jgi:hypothetical protein
MVCLVFEKVNTGGKSLDAFELITATYAASGFDLRADWLGDEENKGIQNRLYSTLLWPNQQDGILTKVSSTEFFQVITLLYTESKHADAVNQGKTGKLPEVSAKKKTLLEVPLEVYREYREVAEDAFKKAAEFLLSNGVYRFRDLPYQSQVTALAAIIAKLGDQFDNTAVKDNLSRWYWCGIFGELYGSSIETRIANDFVEVPTWAVNTKNAEPSTIRDANFNINRLETMWSKQSAAYKGLSILIAKSGAKDYITGAEYNHAVFMDDNVDIDHIFAKNWCSKQGIKKEEYDSIINKTPISSRTNRSISDKAPSVFIREIETGNNSRVSLSSSQVDSNLASHLLDPQLLRNDDFKGFFNDRKERLAKLIEQKMGKPVNRMVVEE